MTAEESLERLWSFYSYFIALGTLGPENERLFKEAIENIALRLKSNMKEQHPCAAFPARL
jgi:hypothetical protein